MSVRMRKNGLLLNIIVFFSQSLFHILLKVGNKNYKTPLNRQLYQRLLQYNQKLLAVWKNKNYFHIFNTIDAIIGKNIISL